MLQQKQSNSNGAVVFSALLFSTLAVFPCAAAPQESKNGSDFLVGIGMASMTGPAADVNMMGYANPGQVSLGIHIRTYARAFIFAEAAQPSNRFVFVTCEIGQISQLLRLSVLRQLKVLFGQNCPYTVDNVALTATHTHSTPAGYFQHFIFGVTSMGFVADTLNAYVSGIVQAIFRAHRSIRPANIFFNKGKVDGAQINRSPTSYQANPKVERQKYDSNVDNIMRLIRIDSATNGHSLGSINWFPVHGVSMNNTNNLISGDNKGYASQMFERYINDPRLLYGVDLGDAMIIDPPPFVAAFAQSAEGDISPNTAGPICRNSGMACHVEQSTCDGSPSECIASGPGHNMEESTKIIGAKQWRAALRIFQAANESIGNGPLRYVHRYVDMSNLTIPLSDGTTVKTCIPALGMAFAAGTTDGPGLGIGFHQAMHHQQAGLLNSVAQMVLNPSGDMTDCHSPKPILLATGLMNDPYPWHPRVVSTQILQLGRLVLLPVPGEFTTMAGRRLAESVKEIFEDDDIEVIVVSLSNGYIHYVTTPEEYTVQRYEGASTIYGPHTLTAFIEIYRQLAHALVHNDTDRLPKGPRPPFRLRQLWSFLPGIIFDFAGYGKRFGDVIQQPNSLYKWHELVSAKFIAGHPRNSVGPRTLTTFMEIQRLEDANWIVIATDAEWETKFKWHRESFVLGTSSATLEWTIPQGTPRGDYRLCYLGHYKPLQGRIEFFRSCSATFTVLDQQL